MKNIIVIVIGIVIILGGIWYFTSNKSKEAIVPVETTVPVPESSGNVPETQVQNVISATDSGFSPSSITIKKGETITFMSESLQPAWPASAIHPTHTVYPGSNIAKCGTTEENGIFDSCKGLLKGEAWSFQFDIPGTWKYHDHLNPSQYGTIIVE